MHRKGRRGACEMKRNNRDLVNNLRGGWFTSDSNMMSGPRERGQGH